MVFEAFDIFLDEVRKINKECKIYIWGIGVYGDLLGKLFDDYSITWYGYYDNFNANSGCYVNNKKVYKGCNIICDENAVYILSMKNYENVKKQLLEMNINENNIIYFSNIEVFNEIDDAVNNNEDYSEEIKEIKDIHMGERCFIIGNGPSLDIESLNKIYENRDISFASNLIFKCYDKTLWRPDYYFFTDIQGLRLTFDKSDVLKYASENCRLFFSRNNGTLKKCKKMINNLILFNFIYSESEEIFNFSEDCSKQLYIGYTVTYAMLQMAVYMGFKEIYLIGMDHNFSASISKDGTVEKRSGIQDHAAILGNYPSWGVGSLDKVTKSYIAAKKYADSHGIKIYNATKGGKLEIFERKDFNNIMKCGDNDVL